MAIEEKIIIVNSISEDIETIESNYSHRANQQTMQGNPINSLSKLIIMTKLERGHVLEGKFWTEISLLQQLWCLNLPNLWNLPTGSMWEGKDWTRFMLLQLQWQKQGLMNLKKCHVNVHEFWQRNKWKFCRQRTFECTHLIGNYGIELQWIWIISLQYVNNHAELSSVPHGLITYQMCTFTTHNWQREGHESKNY